MLSPQGSRLDKIGLLIRKYNYSSSTVRIDKQPDTTGQGGKCLPAKILETCLNKMGKEHASIIQTVELG